MYLTARMMRAITDGYLAKAAGLGAGGIDWVRWGATAAATGLRDGDILDATMTCIAKRPLASRPGVGLVVIEQALKRTDGTLVLGWRSNQFLRLRDALIDVASTGARPTQTGPSETRGVRLALAPNVTVLGAHTFRREEIIAFAARYDPQGFHLDDAAAARSMFGALCASGWHTCSVWHRLMSDELVRRAAFAKFAGRADERLGAESGPAEPSRVRLSGLAALKWLRPVYVDETVTFVAGAAASDTGAGPTYACRGLLADGTPVFEVDVLTEPSDL